MPWFEGRRCEDCDHEWDDIDDSEYVTVGTIHQADADTFTLYSCPQCSLRLYVQRESDGNSWRHQWKVTRASPTRSYRKLVEQVSDRVSKILAVRRTIYQPTVIDIGQIDCTICGIPLVSGQVDRPTPPCPQCDSRRSVRTGSGGVATIRWETDPEDEA
jgi:DNA-directed RNA polymerase subunit RPC12/RpoP